MEREKLESMLIDYIDGKLNTVDKEMIERELMQNPASYRLYEQLRDMLHIMDRSNRLTPSPALKESFDQLLAREVREASKDRTVIFFQPAFYRVAAAVALLLLAGTSGYFIWKSRQQEEKMLALQEEVLRTRELVLSKLNDSQSATQRIIGVQVAYESPRVDDAIVKALIHTMNTDDNTNVRLAAVDALGKFHREPQVRQALVAALTTQKDPLVQMALIQLMVEMKAREAIKPMEKIIQDEQNLPVVKDEAHAGIFKLS